MKIVTSQSYNTKYCVDAKYMISEVCNAQGVCVPLIIVTPDLRTVILYGIYINTASCYTYTLYCSYNV